MKIKRKNLAKEINEIQNNNSNTRTLLISIIDQIKKLKNKYDDLNNRQENVGKQLYILSERFKNNYSKK
jgi:hypothetical protein